MTLASPSRLPIEPIAELSQWSQQLRAIAAQPLELCPDFPQLTRRHEAWWRQANPRPLLLATGGRSGRQITRRLELLDRPAEWLAAKQADLAATYHSRDALPDIRVDFGPVMLGGLIGANVEFQSDTTWTHAFINDDWSNAPDWQIREQTGWWPLLRQLLQLTAADAKGRYLVRFPDLGGSADLLLNLRGSSQLCLDALEQPDQLSAALAAIYPAWRKAFCELYRETAGAGAGPCGWLGLWSDVPYLIPACDFNFMIGPHEFDTLCLPDIVRQAATAGRAVFHLDGPGAAKHVHSLLECPEIQAIQFTPGSQSPSALQWVDMFRQIQRKGRSVLIASPLEEVPDLCRVLEPAGLAFLSGGAPGQIDDVQAQLDWYYGDRHDPPSTGKPGSSR